MGGIDQGVVKKATGKNRLRFWIFEFLEFYECRSISNSHQTNSKTQNLFPCCSMTGTMFQFAFKWQLLIPTIFGWGHRSFVTVAKTVKEWMSHPDPETQIIWFLHGPRLIFRTQDIAEKTSVCDSYDEYNHFEHESQEAFPQQLVFLNYSSFLSCSCQI